MGRFAYESVVKEIKGRLSIIDLIETYVSLKKSGKSYLGLCPFHDDKNPSLHVNEEKGVFHCFACGAGGDIFGFIMRYNSLTFPEAVRELAKRAEIKIEKEHPPHSKKSGKDVLFRVNALASQFYHKLLIESTEGKGARDYLKKRRIPPEIAKEFQLGYAASGWDTLVNFLNNKKVPLPLAEKVGLVIKRKNKDGYYDRFRDRVIFPIHDAEDRVVGFGGRILVEGEPKYMNSPESDVYHKRNILYGLNKSREYIRRKGQVVIVEGYMDLLALYFAGIKNVVATLGTSLTQDHARLLRRYTDKVALVFDGDESGIKAAVRVLEVFLKEGLIPFMVVLPKEDDPHSFISKGKQEEFLKLLQSASPLLDFFIEEIKKDFQNGKISRNVAVQAVADVVSKIKDPIERSHYIKRTAEDFGIRENELLSLVRYGEKVTEAVRAGLKGALDTQERVILRILIKYPNYSSYILEKGAVNFIPDGETKAIIEDILLRGSEDPSSLLLRFTGSSIQGVISEAILFSQDIPDRVTAGKMLEECVRKLELRELENRQRILRLEIDRANREKDRDLEKNLIGKYRDLIEREKKVKGEMHEQ